MKRPTVAVTGATGFVGGRVLRRLAEAGYEVRGGYGPDSARWHVDDIDCEWVETDRSRPASMRRLVRGATGVIHCNGYRPRRSTEPRRAKRNGVYRLRQLFDACVAEGVKRVVYLSSLATVIDGEDGEGLRDEHSRYVAGSTNDGYVEAKGAMESEVYRYIARGLDVVIVIPSFVFGPGDVEGRSRWLVRLVAGRYPSIVPDGEKINIVDVRDLAGGMVGAMETGRTGRRYLVGGEDIALSELFDAIAHHTGRSTGDRMIDAARLQTVAGLGERLIERLGWRQAPSLFADFDLALRAGPVSTERATGELNLRFRSAETVVRDTIGWMERAGYLSWTHRGLSPR